jgi:F-type H+-transporting ATPase subunit b
MQMQIVSNIALITINATLIVQVVSFLIFLFIINRVMFRPLRRTMMQRDKYIESIQQEIDQKKIELTRMAKTIRKKEAAVKFEALELLEKLEYSGNQEAAVIFDTTRQEIETHKKKAVEDIEAAVTAARRSLKEESKALVVDILTKILDRRPAA